MVVHDNKLAVTGPAATHAGVLPTHDRLVNVRFLSVTDIGEAGEAAEPDQGDATHVFRRLARSNNNADEESTSDFPSPPFATGPYRWNVPPLFGSHYMPGELSERRVALRQVAWQAMVSREPVPVVRDRHV